MRAGHFESSPMTDTTASLPDASNLIATTQRPDGPKLVVQIVGAVAFAHLLNDLIQAVLPAIYPMLKEKYHLSFGQIGWIAHHSAMPVIAAHEKIQPKWPSLVSGRPGNSVIARRYGIIGLEAMPIQ